MIDPQQKEARFFKLSEEGRYSPAPIEEGIFRSQILEGFWLKIGWLWQDPPPPLLAVLKE
ncbi:MAG: hypothetical protein IT210_09195 [Armatimonadetes bacterium]|nr:hypothetical protein [Armatimonadota bacterium]